MSQHTPGPWKVDGTVFRGMEANITAACTHELAKQDRLARLSIAHVDNVDGFGANGMGESAANARLIAAAPALLAALEQAVEDLNVIVDHSRNASAQYQKVLLDTAFGIQRNARAAIRAATEGQP